MGIYDCGYVADIARRDVKIIRSPSAHAGHVREERNETRFQKQIIADGHALLKNV
jgi:hypothetical protein